MTTTDALQVHLLCEVSNDSKSNFSFNLLIGFNVYSEVLILSLGSTPVAVVGSPLEFQHHCGGIV